MDQGRVICNFVVEDGQHHRRTVVRGVDPRSTRSRRVNPSVPRWKPVNTGAGSSRVRFTLPVVFRLKN